MPPEDAAPAAPVVTDPAAPTSPAGNVADAGAPAAPAAGTGEPAASGSAEPAAPAPQTIDDPGSILDAPKPADAAPAEPAAPEPIDPAKYEITLPDGITREDPMLAAFLGAAAEQRMDGKAVQAVLDKALPAVQEALAAPHKMWAQLNHEWQGAIKADVELGGANLSASVAQITGFIDRFGGAPVREALAMTGAANHPAIFRFLHTVAKAYAEGSPVIAPTNSPTGIPPDVLRSLYPSTPRPNGQAT